MVLITDRSNSEWQRSMPTNSNPNRCHQLIEQAIELKSIRGRNQSVLWNQWRITVEKAVCLTN